MDAGWRAKPQRFTVTRQADGVYRATGVYFVMPGEWEIRAQLKQGTTMLEQVALGIRI